MMPSKFSAVLEPELIVTLFNIGNICSHYFPQFFCSRLYCHFDYTHIFIDVKLNHKASFFKVMFFQRNINITTFLNGPAEI